MRALWILALSSSTRRFFSDSCRCSASALSNMLTACRDAIRPRQVSCLSGELPGKHAMDDGAASFRWRQLQSISYTAPNQWCAGGSAWLAETAQWPSSSSASIQRLLPPQTGTATQPNTHTHLAVDALAEVLNFLPPRLIRIGLLPQLLSRPLRPAQDLRLVRRAPLVCLWVTEVMEA